MNVFSWNVGSKSRIPHTVDKMLQMECYHSSISITVLIHQHAGVWQKKNWQQTIFGVNFMYVYQVIFKIDRESME